MNNGIHFIHGIFQGNYIQHITGHPFYFIENIRGNKKGKLITAANGTNGVTFHNKLFDDISADETGAASDKYHFRF